ESSGTELVAAISLRIGRRLRATLDAEIVDLLLRLGERSGRVDTALRALPEDGPATVVARRQRAQQLHTALREDLAVAATFAERSVTWVEGPESDPRLRVAPIEIAELLQNGLWSDRTTVLTSATLPAGLDDRLGLDPGEYESIDVGSPFDYENATLLYCA